MAGGLIRDLLGYMPDLLLVAGVVAMVTVPLFAWRGRRVQLGRILLVVLAYAVAFCAKSLAKWIAGRTWPETWLASGLNGGITDNPSFIQDGAYGFHPFHGGTGYGAFPSGHMTVTMAVLVVGWALFPRLRRYLAPAAPAMAVLLIGLNFHFVADVIAGAWLGAACGAITLTLPTLVKPRGVATSGGSFAP